MPLSRIRLLTVLLGCLAILSGCGDSATIFDPPVEIPLWDSVLSQAIEATDAWGAGPDAWALLGVNGHLALFDGSSWTLHQPPVPFGMRALWGFAPDALVMVGFKGRVYRYDGDTYHTESSGTEAFLRDVWGPASNEIYAVGFDGTIIRYDGSRWNRETSGTDRDLYGVHGADGHVFAVGKNGLVLHKAPGAGWVTLRDEGTLDLYSVWATGATSVYAVGEPGAGVHYDGTNWNDLGTDDLRVLWHVTAVSDTEVWASGGSEDQIGRAARYDGSTWTVEDGDRWRAVHALPNGDLALCTGGGVRLRTDGTGTAWKSGLDFRGFNTVTGINDDQVWGFAVFGADLSRSGDHWKVIQDAPQSIRESWADPATGRVWLSTSDFRVFFLESGSYVEAYQSAMTAQFVTIWGTEGHVFAGGADGAVAHFDGGAWSEVQLPSSPNNAFVQDIHGSSPTDVYAVLKDRVHHYDGTDWTEVGRWDSADYFFDKIAVRGPDDVFIMGSMNVGSSSFRNLLYHWDGTEWTSFYEQGAVESWSDLALDANRDLVIVGTKFLTGSDHAGLMYRMSGETVLEPGFLPKQSLGGPDIGGFEGLWISEEGTIHAYENVFWRLNPEQLP